jgi:hypothetical protein
MIIVYNYNVHLDNEQNVIRYVRCIVFKCYIYAYHLYHLCWCPLLQS